METSKRLRLPTDEIGNTELKQKNYTFYTFLVFDSYDNRSYCFESLCSTYKDATNEYLSYMDRYDRIGKITHDNVIKWEDGSFSVLSILNGHIQDDFSSWVKEVNENEKQGYEIQRCWQKTCTR